MPCELVLASARGEDVTVVFEWPLAGRVVKALADKTADNAIDRLDRLLLEASKRGRFQVSARMRMTGIQGQMSVVRWRLWSETASGTLDPAVENDKQFTNWVISLTSRRHQCTQAWQQDMVVGAIKMHAELLGVETVQAVIDNISSGAATGSVEQEPRQSRAKARPYLDLMDRVEFAGQSSLRDRAGHYLIFRRTRLPDTPTLVVSHMEVRAVPALRDKVLPHEYRTHGLPLSQRPEAKMRRPDSKYVEGFCFANGGGDSSYYNFYGFIGEEAVRGDTGQELRPSTFSNAEPRASMLLPRSRKPTTLRNQTGLKTDLAGIRLGLGYQDGMPRGYRVWCAYIGKTMSKAKYESVIGEYSLKPKPDQKQVLEALARTYAQVRSKNVGGAKPAGDIDQMIDDFRKAYRPTTSPVDLETSERASNLRILVPDLDVILDWLSVESFAASDLDPPDWT